MSITKEKLYKIIEDLNEIERQTAYEFISFLIYRSAKRLSWAEIDALAPDPEQLDDLEKAQFDQPENYITLEKAIEEYDL